jgi:hypothetical protein
MKMKFKILVLAGVMGIIVPGLAQTNPPSVSGARMTFAAPDYDFGKVDSGTLVKHDFVFTNTGDQVLEVSGVRTSCGCTTAGQWDKQVEPGHTGKIPIQFNSGGYGGQVHKTVYVTCNDSNQPSVTLNLQGTVWKLFNVIPAYAVFNLQPEAQSNQTQVLKIVNNGDLPVAVSDPTCGSPAFQLEFKTVQVGKVFELRVTALVSKISQSLSAPITLKTSSPKMPQISLSAFAMMQPLLTINPSQITLPAGPLPKPMQFRMFIQANGPNPVVLSEPKVNATGVEVQLTEQQPGRQFSLTVSFPAGFQSQSGLQATVKSSNPKYPLITVPVYQPASPKAAAATPAASPAIRNGSAAVQPVSAMSVPMTSRK